MQNEISQGGCAKLRLNPVIFALFCRQYRAGWASDLVKVLEKATAVSDHAQAPASATVSDLALA